MFSKKWWLMQKTWIMVCASWGARGCEGFFVLEKTSFKVLFYS
jgi:hypothetical protein